MWSFSINREAPMIPSAPAPLITVGMQEGATKPQYWRLSAYPWYVDPARYNSDGGFENEGAVLPGLGET